MWPATGIDKASCLLRNKFAIPQLKNYITNSLTDFDVLHIKWLLGLDQRHFLKQKCSNLPFKHQLERSCMYIRFEQDRKSCWMMYLHQKS